MRPHLSPAAEEAKRVWNAMGKWRPESIPVLIVLLDIEYIDGLMDRLLAIRHGVDEDRSNG